MEEEPPPPPLPPPPPGPPRPPPGPALSLSFSISFTFRFGGTDRPPTPPPPPPAGFNLAQRLFREDADSPFLHNRPPVPRVLRGGHTNNDEDDAIMYFWSRFAYQRSMFRDAMGQLNEGIVQYMAAASVDTTRFSEATGEPILTRLTLEWVRAWERGLVRTASVTFLDTLSEDRTELVRRMLGVRIRDHLRRLGLEEEAQRFWERAANEPIEGVGFVVIWICSVGQTLLADRDGVSSLGHGTDAPPA